MIILCGMRYIEKQAVSEKGKLISAGPSEKTRPLNACRGSS